MVNFNFDFPGVGVRKRPAAGVDRRRRFIRRRPAFPTRILVRFLMANASQTRAVLSLDLSIPTTRIFSHLAIPQEETNPFRKRDLKNL